MASVLPLALAETALPRPSAPKSADLVREKVLCRDRGDWPLLSIEPDVLDVERAPP